MRFVCDSCRAQYMISDEKVGAKGVKVRCKKCGHVILVKRGEGAAPADASGSAPEAELSQEAAESTVVVKRPEPSPSAIFGGVDDDELGAAFDQALSPGSAPPKEGTEALIASQLGSEGPNDVESTRVMDAAAMKRLAAESEESQPKPEDEKKAAADSHEWFVAIDEKQTGPLTVAKIKEHWDRGEITADSLTWRAGLADWVPMSEVSELAAILAPRPTKPIIIAPAPLSPPTPSAPVESAFSGSARSTRTEIKPMAAAGAEEAGGWRPTAAHALVSLMKDEMAALQRPTSTSMRPALQSAAAAPAAPGLLDVPASVDAGHNGHAALEHEAPVVARTGQQRAMSPPPPSSYAAPPPAYGTYRPGPPPNANRTMVMVGGAIVVVLLLIGGSIIYLLSRTGPTPIPVAQAPLPVPVQAAPAPVAAAPTPAPAPAPAAAPSKAIVPPGAVAEATPGVQPARSTTPVRAPDIIAPSPEGGHRGRGKAKHIAGIVEDPAVSSAPMPPEPSSDDFDKAFGAPETKKGPAAPPPIKRRETYVPPAPGASATLEELGVGDIMQVVNNNKSAVVHCVEEQKKKEPSLTGQLVMHFAINTNGRTSGVAVSPQSSEFKSSYMASCITGLIKGWRFPPHKQQHDPVDFPFKF